MTLHSKWLTLLPSLILAVACFMQGCTKPPPIDETQLPRAHHGVLAVPPDRANAQRSYLFYLHGRIIEEAGIRPVDPRYGVYEYEQILETLADRGFIVISEPRAKGTDPSQYATKVSAEIEKLLREGVPPEHITVVGASKGAVIAMLVSTYVKNRDINFVLLSNCNPRVEQHFPIDLHGNVLSIYDYKDEFAATCTSLFAKAKGLNRSKEVVLRLGIGHALVYRPLMEWTQLVSDWHAESNARQRN